MPRIIAKPDSLDDLNPEFSQIQLEKSVFLNSVPKCGTHLLKNIIRMFVPVNQQHKADFIQFPNLKENRAAFLDKSKPMLSWGHLLFSDTPSLLLRNVKHVLLVRDPYDWVLARARFFLSDNFQANLEHLKAGRAPLDDFLNMMIFGIFNKVPTLEEIFTNNAVSWLGTSARLVRYEDLLHHVKNIDTNEAETFFSELLKHCGIDLPEDWRKRVKIGADRKQSGTARENLDLKIQIPDTLPDIQKKLVDYAAPGLRQLLGYG